ncbi:MAG TPA: cbb3-type cytochrome c oxidase subunit I [Nitrospirota bacterium]|jgi:cytochrome c oxidase cbb3-type subunit 1
MDKEVVWFIRLSVVYFLLGSLMGLMFAVKPESMNGGHIAMHVHLNLVGWMSMMIFGVGYHILPRFSGRPLYSRKLSIVQFWTANIGLAGMLAGWGMTAHNVTGAQQVLAVFSGLMVLSIFLFVYNMLMTVQGPAK